MVLTERQKKELNRSILEYLMAEPEGSFTRTIETFQQEAMITDTSDFGKNILEKKWTSVIRLQKRVLDLEAQVAELQRSGARGDMPSSGVSNDNRVLLPRGPAKASLSGHRGAITAVAVHPIYSIIASGSEDTTIKIWDFDTAQYERTLKSHTGPVSGLVYSKSGALLASCSSDLSAKIWDMNTFACTKTLKGHDHQISDIKFVPSDDFLLTCSRDNTIRMWEVSTGFCVKMFTGHSDWVRCLSVSLDGNFVASGSVDQTAMIWRISNGQPVQVLRGHEHVVDCIAFGKKPFSASELLVNSSESSSSMIIAEDSTTSDGNGSSGGSSNSTSEVGLVASGSRDRSIKVWDPIQGVCLMTFTAHENWVRSLVFHASGKFLFSCSDDKTIRVMDLKEGRCSRTISDAHGHFVTCLSLSNKQPILVSGSVDKCINIWTCS